MKKQHRFTWLVLCLVVVAVPGPPTDALAPTPDTPSTAMPALLQFTSAGHVLGFATDGVYVASGSHAYRVEFAGAAPTAPVADSAQSDTGRAAPLSRVTYPDLWPGITLTYDAPEGAILRSSYRLEPFADPSAIRLRYNVPVEIESDGTLALAYATGVMRESAPVAWQEVEGERVPVAVAFQILGEREVGFRLGAYDPAYPLSIDPALTWNTFFGSGGEDYGNSIAGAGTMMVVPLQRTRAAVSMWLGAAMPPGARPPVTMSAAGTHLWPNYLTVSSCR